ncbi:MAG: M56 family metallopeptidase, partial [Pseudomonadales bacterium]
MSSLFTEFINDPIVERIGWALLHSLWLFTLVGLGLWIVLRLMSRARANTRHLIECVTFFAMPVIMVATYFAVELPITSSLVEIAETNSIAVVPSIAVDRPSASPVADVGDNAEIPVAVTGQSVAPAIATEAAAETSWYETLSRFVRPWLPTIVTCWLIGIALFSARPFVAWHAVRRLKTKGTSPVLAATAELLKQTADQLGLRRTVRILQSALVETPAVIGYLKPLILLPASVLSGLSTDQLRALLAHEIAHIRRHDYLINVLQTTVETLFFYHPAVWWASRVIRNERENCCDDVAVALCKDRATYAEALLAMDKLRPVKPSLALSAKGGSLLCRIRRLAGLTPSDRSSSNWWATGLIVLAAALTVALVLPMSSEAIATMDEDATAETEWGEPVDGLRMRVVPVHFGMSEENVDMNAVQRKFAAQKEVAFAIEMENVSEEPIKVLDTGYGNSFGASSGKPKTDWFSQFLFTIEYFDADGRKLEYPLVEHVMPSMILGSTKISEIAAGQSHRFLIRPEKWSSIHYQRLPHRKYSAVVHYHGLPKHAADKIREGKPDKEVLTTWSGDVASVATGFQIARPKLPGTMLNWGEPDNGLRAALSFAEALPWYGHGQKLDLLLHVENVGDRPITLSSGMWCSVAKLT